MSWVWVRVRCPIKAGLHQSGTSWYPVITASNYKVEVLVMSIINYVTLEYTNSTQNTRHKTAQTPHKTSSGEGLQSPIALSSLNLSTTKLEVFRSIMTGDLCTEVFQYIIKFK